MGRDFTEPGEACLIHYSRCVFILPSHLDSARRFLRDDFRLAIRSRYTEQRKRK